MTRPGMALALALTTLLGVRAAPIPEPARKHSIATPIATPRRCSGTAAPTALIIAGCPVPNATFTRTGASATTHGSRTAMPATRSSSSIIW